MRLYARSTILFVAMIACFSLLACGVETTKEKEQKGTSCGGSICPKGQFCWNGLCMVGCNTDNECTSNQYCDTDIKQCARKTVPTCPSTPCGANQTCVQGFCSAKVSIPPVKKEDPKACKPAADGNDGCAKNALCIEPEDGKVECRSFPRCGLNGACPTGLVGSICNNGYIPNKDKICLIGLCKEDKNCPSSWKCIQGGQVLGFCSNGATGSFCTKNEHCKEGNKCISAAPGSFGACFPGGGFPDPPKFP